MTKNQRRVGCGIAGLFALGAVARGIIIGHCTVDAHEVYLAKDPLGFWIPTASLAVIAVLCLLQAATGRGIPDDKDKPDD